MFENKRVKFDVCYTVYLVKYVVFVLKFVLLAVFKVKIFSSFSTQSIKCICNV